MATRYASIIDQAQSTGQSNNVKTSGSCNSIQSNPFWCCRLKCCPRNKNGTAASTPAIRGFNDPHAPTPAVNSVQISRIAPSVVRIRPAEGSELWVGKDTTKSSSPSLVIALPQPCLFVHPVQYYAILVSQITIHQVVLRFDLIFQSHYTIVLRLKDRGLQFPTKRSETVFLNA